MDIEFIYFDIGNVLAIAFLEQKWNQMLVDLGVKPEDYERFDTVFTEYENILCVGTDIESIKPEFEKQFGIKFADNFSWLDYFANGFDKNEELWKFIPELKKKYKLGLLTNMYPGLLNALNSKNRIDKSYFDVIVDSSVVKYQKPDQKIYEIAETFSETKPENILFVEDSARHIEAAKLRGWNTLKYNPKNVSGSNEELLNFIQ